MKNKQVTENIILEKNTNVIELDLSKDFELRKLYLEFPYFTEVLKWMSGKTEYGTIQHYHTELQFSARVLPELKARMTRLGLLEIINGNMVPCFDEYKLKNIPSGNATQMVIANHIYESVVRRAGTGLAELRIKQLKVRASSAAILSWLERLNHLYSEIEAHGPSTEGEVMVISSLTTIGE